jgi:hypothetical protein
VLLEQNYDGLPSVDLAVWYRISPVNPDIIYLSVEAAENKSGSSNPRIGEPHGKKVNDYASSVST